MYYIVFNSYLMNYFLSMNHLIDKYQVMHGKLWKNFIFPVTATNSALLNLSFPVTSIVGLLPKMHDLHQPDTFWYAKSHLAFRFHFVSCHSCNLICYLKPPLHPFHLGKLELKSGWCISAACVCMHAHIYMYVHVCEYNHGCKPESLPRKH